MQGHVLDAALVAPVQGAQLLLAVQVTQWHLLDVLEGVAHYAVQFAIVGQQLDQGAYTVDVGLLGVLAVAADDLAAELADGLVAVEGDLADGLAELVREAGAEVLEVLDYLSVLQGGQDEFELLLGVHANEYML